MASGREIKNWIQEVKTGRVIPEESILIQKSGVNETRIILLDHACCRPQIRISKKLEEIKKEDFFAFEHVINHAH